MVVLVLIALASGLASLALRDSRETRIEREAVRLAALLEAGRAESRALGIAVRFELRPPGEAGAGAYRFAGMAAAAQPPGQWLEPDTTAEIVGARALRLGPEPLIGAQRIVLRQGDQQRIVATDGLAPFAMQPATPP
jgi:general secretion pathway protein H